MRLYKLGKSFILTTLGVGTLAMSLSGCAENRTSLFIYGVLAPNDDCTVVVAGQTQPQLFSGTYAIRNDIPRGYSAAFNIANQLTRLGDATTFRPETSYVAVEGAEVNLLSGDGASTVESFSVVATSTIPPASGTSPGFGAVSVLLVPPSVNVSNGDTFVAEVRVFGKTLGGLDVQTPWSSFPIEVWQVPNTCSALFCGTEFRGCDN